MGINFNSFYRNNQFGQQSMMGKKQNLDGSNLENQQNVNNMEGLKLDETGGKKKPTEEEKAGLEQFNKNEYTGLEIVNKLPLSPDFYKVTGNFNIINGPFVEKQIIPGSEPEVVEPYRPDLKPYPDPLQPLDPNDNTGTVTPNEPDTVQDKEPIISKVLENIFNSLKEELSAKLGSEEKSGVAAKEQCNELEVLAREFAKNYTGNNFEVDLIKYLQNCMNKKEMQDDVDNYREVFKQQGNFIDDRECGIIKDAAKKLLLAALESGIDLKYGKYDLTTPDGIDKFLDSFSKDDADKLNTAIEELINSMFS